MAARSALLTLLVLPLLTACPEEPGGGGGDPTPPWDPFADYEPDPEVFAAPFSEVGLVERRGGQVPPDQLVVGLVDPEDDAALQAVLAELEAEVIGQIPRLGAYQLRLPTDTVPELDAAAAAARALPGVSGAAANGVQDWLQASPYCHLEDDNHLRVSGVNRCAFADIQYYQAARIFKEAASRMTTSPVKVAVVDSGLQKDFGQFDDVPVLNLADPSRLPVDDHGHGTRVSGLIAADTGDGGTNGIASVILGPNRVALEVGGFAPDTFTTLTAVSRAVFDGHADVVNMSYGRRYDPADEPEQALVMSLYIGIVTAAPNTVFVTSAGNHNEPITATRHSPAGLRADNFITVGGTAHCDPSSRWIHSDPAYGTSWGPLVDLSAPAQNVPLLPYDPRHSIYNPGGDPITGHGTSYSSPMVAAAAAIMKSFDSTLTGAEIKHYLTHWAFPTDESINWARLVLVPPIEQMLIDRGAPQGVLDLIDADEQPGEWDVGGMVVNRLCGGADVTVDGLGSWHFDDEEETWGGGVNDMGLFLWMSDESGDVGFGLTQQAGAFNVPHEYQVPGQMEVAFSMLDRNIGCNGTAGTIAFTKCAITERSGLDQTPLMMELEGRGAGGLECMEPPGLTPVNRTFSLFYSLPVVVYPGSTAGQVAEQVCEGGLMQ